MAGITAPLVFTETLSLNSLQQGLTQLSVVKAAVEGQHVAFVGKVDDRIEIIFVDVTNQANVVRRQVVASEFTIHPTLPLVAFLHNGKLQVYDIQKQQRVSGINFEHPLSFWKFAENEYIILVSDKAVFRWKYNDNSEVRKIFDRHTNFATRRIIDAGMDSKLEYMYILGQQPGENGDVISSIQLYSIERAATQLIDAYQMSFATWKVGNNPKPSTLLVIGTKQGKGSNVGRLSVVELSSGGPETFQKRVVDVPFNDVNDYPIAIRVSEKFGLLHVLSRHNNIFAYELETITPIYHSVINLSAPVVSVTGFEAVGGYNILTADNSVVSIAVNEKTLVPFMIHNGKHDIALKFATRCTLPGAEEIIVRKFEQLFHNDRDYIKAAELAAATPVLRTPESLRLFRSVGNVNGTSVANVYFNTILKNPGAVLNKVETLEISNCAVNQNRPELVEKLLAEKKLTACEELGDMVKRVNPRLAMSIYIQANDCPGKVVQLLAEQGEFDKIINFCTTTNFAPDYVGILRNVITSHSPKTADFAYSLVNVRPYLVEPEKVVDCFEEFGEVENCTKFLFRFLTQDIPENGRLQTRAIEMNLNHTPKVADAILSRRIFNHYDKPYIAQLCEKAQLYHHALEMYDNVSDIKRVLTLIPTFDNEKIVEFCGKLSAEDCFECVQELVKHGGPERVQLATLIANKYSDFLGSDKIIKLFETYRQNGALFYYLQSIVNTSTDPEVHFKYIQAAVRNKQMKDAERVCRDSQYYDPQQVIAFLKEANLQSHIPLIIVCDKHDRIKELIEYLYREKAMSSIEILATQVNPKRLPAIVGALFDLDCPDDQVKKLINNMRRDFDIDALVDACSTRNRLRLLQTWLENRIQNGATDTPTHNALAKVYVEGSPFLERYLKEDKYYDAKVIGEYCEKRNPHLAFIAYEREQLDEEIVKLCYDNALFKNLVRYLLSRADPALWERVLRDDDGNRRKLIDHIVQFIQVEHQSPEDISVMVKAFVAAGLSQGLLDVLEKLIISGGSYREHRNLQTLMVVTAIREAPNRVMGYITVLDNYDAPAIAELAVSHQLYEEAFEIYRRFDVNTNAVTVLIENLKDYKRAYDFAERVNKPDVWSALGLAQLRNDQVAEGIESLIRAGQDNAVQEVVQKCTERELYDELVKYLQMARKTSRDTTIDTELCFAYAKTNRLRDIEDLLTNTNRVDIVVVGDRCYEHNMFDAAKVVFSFANNFSKSALTLVKLGEWQGAVDAARKANSVKTWKVVCFACVERKEFHLAMVCGLQIVIHAEEIEELLQFYQNRGYFEELIQLLEAALSSERTHVAMFTELAVLYTKHKPEKLHDHLDMFWTRMNMRKVLIATEAAHLWADLVFLYDKNEDYENAALTMMKHPAAWKEGLFKEVIVKVGNVEIFFKAAEFYLEYHPLLLNDLLIALSSRLDHTRLVTYFIKADQLAIIKPYLRHVQTMNNKIVNENLNQLLIDDEDYKGLRESIDVYNNFDNVALAQQLENHELLEFRRISAYLYRRNNRWSTSIELCKKDKLYTDAIEFASESRNQEVVQELITYFIENELHDCFSTMLYKCYDLLKPDYVMELAWKHRVTDYAMPYYIQTVKNMNSRMERLEYQLEELKTKDTKQQDEQLAFNPHDHRMAIGYTPNYNSFA
uniref:Clathrin heavy chain n=1 Tax=Panagrellus redivivus TaxID=6233 RepID=A0A7E4VKZ1_PANRE